MIPYCEICDELQELAGHSTPPCDACYEAKQDYDEYEYFEEDLIAFEG